MKRIFGFVFLLLLIASCSSSKIDRVEEKNIQDVYIKMRLKDEKREILYLSVKPISNIFIVDALESVQYQSGKDDCILKEEFCLAKHFLDGDVMNYYYSQLSNFSPFKKQNFGNNEIVLVDWDLLMSNKNKNEDLIKKAISSGAKSISVPLISKDYNYALILEKSNRHGCVIFLYKKKDDQWVEYDSITTCL